MDSEAELLWGLLFGSVGLGFFVYGKKQAKIVPFVCGLALMVYPYFMPNAVTLVLMGVVLVVIPYFIRL
jgi:predicted membrane protein